MKILGFGRYATAWEAQYGRVWVHIRYPRFWKTSGLGFVRWLDKDGNPTK